MHFYVLLQVAKIYGKMVLNLCRFEIWHPKYPGKAPKATDSNCRQNNTQRNVFNRNFSPPLSPYPLKEQFGSIITTTELKLFIVLNRKRLQIFLAHSVKTDLSNSVFFRDILLLKSKKDISGLYVTTSNSSGQCVKGISSA